MCIMCVHVCMYVVFSILPILCFNSAIIIFFTIEALIKLFLALEYNVVLITIDSCLSYITIVT